MSQRARLSVIRMLTVVGAVMWALTGSPSAHGIASVVVDTTADDTFVNGNCTFREAIIATSLNHKIDECLGQFGGANDNIYFDIGTGTPRIDIAAGNVLPQIVEQVNIYGATGGADRIEINGPGGPFVSGQYGLWLIPTAAGSSIHSLVINNSADDGILIDADEVTILDTFIGTNAAGTAPEPNMGFGIHVKGNGNRIGNAFCGSRCNLISGNAKAQVLLDVDSSGTFVQGNYIGPDASGFDSLILTNVEGVVDRGQGNRIGGSEGTTPGGPCTGDCNVISGNGGQAGVFLDTMAAGAVIQGNFIGTDVNGSADMSNGFLDLSSGIQSRSPGALIGGTTPEARNVVSGNKGAQILIRGINNVVQGNYVGTNASGIFRVFNEGAGIYLLGANGTMVGGTGGAGNLISGTGSAGVNIGASTNSQLIGNTIGISADGSSPLGNQGDGISIFADSTVNTIGPFNVIAFNGVDGISTAPAGSRANKFTKNSIYSNDGLGIDLAGGANDGILPPVITGVESPRGTACIGCVVEIFSDDTDEGRIYEGQAVADGTGNWVFPAAVTGPLLTATATDISGNTSEFSVSVSAFARIQGDINCDGEVTSEDFEFLLEFAARLNDGESPTPDCSALAGQDTDPQYAWGDINCDGFVNALDALYLLAHLAGITLTPVGAGCTPIGDEIQV